LLHAALACHMSRQPILQRMLRQPSPPSHVKADTVSHTSVRHTTLTHPLSSTTCASQWLDQICTGNRCRRDQYQGSSSLNIVMQNNARKQATYVRLYLLELIFSVGESTAPFCNARAESVSAHHHGIHIPKLPTKAKGNERMNFTICSERLTGEPGSERTEI
jgi:hypothetical protein